MKTLKDLWGKSSHRFRHQTAAVYQDLRIGYAEQVTRGRKLAGAMKALGVGPQDRVAMLAMNTYHWFDYYCAAEISGFIAATVNFRLATPELAYIIKDSAPCVVIFEAQYAAAVGGIRAQLTDVKHYVCIGGPRPEWALDYDEVFANGDPAVWTAEPLPEDIARLLYTSGTTGRPKGAARSHRAELADAFGLSSDMNMSDATRQLLSMPMFHLGSQSMGLAANLVGGCNVLQRSFDPLQYLRLIESEKITSLHLAPVMLQTIINVPDVKSFDTSSLRVILYSAAPMPLTVLKQSLEVFGEVDFVNLYGSTEMGLVTTLTPQQHRQHAGTPRLASIGLASLVTEVRILDDQGNECSPGQAGELAMRGDCQFSYYWNNSAATVEAMRSGWLRSGDIAFADEEGYLFLVDRRKDMIISGGENIYCREVEEALMAHPAVQDAAVIGVPDERWHEAVKAIVVLKEGQSVSESALIDHCGTLIARYKRPKSVAFVAELPRLPSGKVHKPTLRERYRS